MSLKRSFDQAKFWVFPRPNKQKRNIEQTKKGMRQMDRKYKVLLFLLYCGVVPDHRPLFEDTRL